jgi:hypothetical protein
MHPRACLVALLVAAGVPAAGAEPTPASITIAGGVSLGAYEAGLTYYAVEMLRVNPGLTELRLATGASAGSVNSLVSLLQSCGPAAPDPRQSLFWKAWIPLGLAGLTKSGETAPTAAFTRSAFDPALALVRDAWVAGLRADCDVVFGLSVTRLEPRMVSVKGDRLQLPRVEEHFVVRIRGRGPGHPPRLTNYVDPAWEGEQTLLPEGADGEIPFPALVDALFASTAFPGAFPPQAIRHCIVQGGDPGWPGCPEADARSDLFVDGGVFDNTPVRLARDTSAAGLRVEGGKARWADRPRVSQRGAPGAMVFAYVSPDVRTFPPPSKEHAGQTPKSILAVAARVGGAFYDSARAKNLLYVHDEDPEFFDRLAIAERHLPAASSPMGAFFGFFETALREFDFALGMYDARRMGEQRLTDRLARAGRPGKPVRPETFPDAAAAVDSWQPYRCLSAVLDAPADAEAACRGEALRDFRIVLQTSIERLWDRCASPEILGTVFAEDPLCRAAAEGRPPLQVPGVAPLPADAFRSRKGETETAYCMRLLVAHQFAFKDLGLSAEEAGEAPARLRARLLQVGHAVARSQPAGQGAAVEAAVKLAADQVIYVPPRNTGWVVFGRDLEAGVSRGFTVDRALVSSVRLHGAIQLNNSTTVLSSEHGSAGLSLLAGVEVLPATWATSAFQPSFIVRGGMLFSGRDEFGFGSCPNPDTEQVASCSRPVLGAGVAAAALERLRFQLLFNWYFPMGNQTKAWWTLVPALGVQWPF